MLKGKKVRKLIVALTITIGFVVLLNIILESILKNYISAELNLIGEQNEHVLGIGDVDIHIFRGNISITDFYTKPNEVLFKSFAKGETKKNALKQLFVSKISLSGLGLFDLLVKKEVLLDRIKIDKLNFSFYRPKKEYQVKAVAKEKKSTFSLDSIRLSGINKIDLSEMEIEDYGIHVIDASSKDTISSYKGKDFLINGLEMEALDGNKGYFTFDNSDLELSLKEQEFHLEGGLYAVSFDNLHCKYDEEEIQLINFEFKPIASPEEFSSEFNQVYDISTAVIDTLLISGIDIHSLFQSGVISIQQIDVMGLTSSTFMDKTKAWDFNKITNLPQMALENMRQPLHVSTIKVHNSCFAYSEKLTHTDEYVNVNIDNIQGEITYVTSIRDSIDKKKSMDIKLSADLLNTLPFTIQLTMPYNTQDHSFYASGHTKGISDFKKLNSTVFPATNMKFKNGKIEGINFNFRGNRTRTSGELTMLYEDLEVELFKKDETQNKKVSWVANKFIKKSNPSKRGRTIVAEINFERVKYKGLGNYLWKSIQSGIVNSLVPFGKHKKKEN